MLRSENKKDRAADIPFVDLQSVVRNAVTVCQALSVQYLWVDALCIVQGVHGDFKEEAIRMHNVYAGSLFTIVEASSTDPT